MRSILAGGVLGAVDADPSQAALRGLAFWYSTAGIGLLALGWAITQIERRGPVPRSLPLVLAGVGAWGLLFVPTSPFWVFPALAVLAQVRRRRAAYAST